MAGNVEQSFLAWFRENGGWIDDRCDVREIPNMGRGLIAKAPIAENERVFAIPRTMLMNLTTSHLAEQCAVAEREALFVERTVEEEACADPACSRVERHTALEQTCD